METFIDYEKIFEEENAMYEMMVEEEKNDLKTLEMLVQEDEKTMKQEEFIEKLFILREKRETLEKEKIETKKQIEVKKSKINSSKARIYSKTVKIPVVPVVIPVVPVVIPVVIPVHPVYVVNIGELKTVDRFIDGDYDEKEETEGQRSPDRPEDTEEVKKLLAQLNAIEQGEDEDDEEEEDEEEEKESIKSRENREQKEENLKILDEVNKEIDDEEKKDEILENTFEQYDDEHEEKIDCKTLLTDKTEPENKNKNVFISKRETSDLHEDLKNIDIITLKEVSAVILSYDSKICGNIKDISCLNEMNDKWLGSLMLVMKKNNLKIENMLNNLEVIKHSNEYKKTTDLSLISLTKLKMIAKKFQVDRFTDISKKSKYINLLVISICNVELFVKCNGLVSLVDKMNPLTKKIKQEIKTDLKEDNEDEEFDL